MANILQLKANITEEMLTAATRLHNQFPSDSPFPQIDVLSAGFQELCAIIAKYNVQSCFCLRLLHRHTTIPEGHILLGTSITEPLGYWTRPTRISDIDLQKIYPHIISVNLSSSITKGEKRTLYPSEFREGLPGNVRNIDGDFFTEFTNCLLARGLENTLGLEARQGEPAKMIEFSSDVGSLLVKDEEVSEEMRGQFKLQETGWTVVIKDDTVDQTGESRCVTFENGHSKITNGQIKGVSDFVKLLRDDGILAM